MSKIINKSITYLFRHVMDNVISILDGDNSVPSSALENRLMEKCRVSISIFDPVLLCSLHIRFSEFGDRKSVV